MANNNAPYGFRVFQKLDGSSPNLALEAFTINSSDANLYFTGDPVALSSAAAGVLQPYFGSSVAPTMLGIFRGCEFFSPTVGRNVWSAFFPGSVSSSNPVTAYVITDPDMLYTVQASSGPIGSSQIGQVFNITAAQSSLGNQTTGVSAVSLNSSTASAQTAAAVAPFKLWGTLTSMSSINVGVAGGDDTTAFNTVVVKPNTTVRTVLTGIST